MANTAREDDDRQQHMRRVDVDDDETLTEVGEDRDYVELDDEADPFDRRRDPLRLPR